MKTQPDFNTLPEFYKNYVMNVKDADVMEALSDSGDQMFKLIASIPDEKKDYRYEAGKWGIREVLVHLMDGERIFAYRALTFARNDSTVLPGFEQDDYVPESNAASRSLRELADEMKRLRITTIDLFKSFTSEMMARQGSANKNVISVINLGYVIAGHETHHYKILLERYLKNNS
jgi:uncharacterized damage-inducible protein DinB